MSRIKRAYVYRFYRTDEQKQQLAGRFGCCRFVYNWALSLRQQTYHETGKGLSYKTLDAQMTMLRHEPATCFLGSGILCAAATESAPPDAGLHQFLRRTRRFPDLQETAGVAIGHLYEERLCIQKPAAHAFQNGQAA